MNTPTPRFDSIKRLAVVTAGLIIVLTFALVPLLSARVEATLLRQTEDHLISEARHLNAMRWPSFVGPVLVERTTDVKMLSDFQAFLNASTQIATLQTLTLYDRDGQRVFVAAQHQSDPMAPDAARAAMYTASSTYTSLNGRPVLLLRLPVMSNGSIRDRSSPLPQANIHLQHLQETAVAANVTLAAVAPDMPIGLMTLEQDMQSTAAVIQRFQITMGGLLVVLMGALLASLLWAMRRTDRIISGQYNQLATQNVTLQRLERDKEELSRMVLHDLRNPASAIISSLEMLQMPHFGGLSSTQSEIVTQAQGSGRRLIDMLNDLLLIGRLQDGKLQLNTQPFQVATTLPHLIKEMQPLAKQSGHVLSYEIAPDAPVALLDENVFQRILSNLVGNALRHTPPGTAVRVTARAADDALEVRVADDGPGIAPEDQKRIWERWTQGSGHGTGHGLGLTFCQLAVVAHGGTIQLESTLDAGAVFVMRFPVAVVAPSEQQNLVAVMA